MFWQLLIQRHRALARARLDGFDGLLDGIATKISQPPPDASGWGNAATGATHNVEFHTGVAHGELHGEANKNGGPNL